MESEYSAIMLGRSAFLFLALANLSLSGVGAVQVRNKVNPIRRVVTLLQEMAKKITEEGVKVSQESRVEKRWISQFGILEELFVF